MRSGFFALFVLSLAWVITGCSTPVPKATAAPPANTIPVASSGSPQQPTNTSANSSSNLSSSTSTTSSPNTRGSSSNQADTSNANTSTTPKAATSPANNATGSDAAEQQKQLLELARSRRNTLPQISYPVLHQGSKGTPVLRLQQLLASLGYLPVTWHPKTQAKPSPRYELQAYSFPPAGHWSWSNKSIYSHLHQYWNASSYSVITQGAVMAFERDHGLTVDGVAGPQVWSTLMTATMKHQTAKHGYSYVYVSKHQPERLTLWHNGKVVLSTLANTGIAAAPTPNGTWPIYLRFRSQTMTGTNPNGSHYSDKGVPYVNYFYKGDAVHGFIRSSYGYPQSLGCVELPYSRAKTAWQYLYYGALVTVGP